MIMIYGTFRYATNIKSIANKFWPSRRKATVWNLLFVSTANAIGFFTIYMAGTLAILGANPIGWVKQQHKSQKFLHQTPFSNAPLDAIGTIVTNP